MSDGHRRLPPWMAPGEVKEKEPLRCRRTRKGTRSAFYCMNEAELVEAAAAYLTYGACPEVVLLSDRKVEDEDKAGDATVKIREEPASLKSVTEALEEPPPDCNEAKEMTYVSETDENDELEAEKREEHSQKASDGVKDDDGDALRLVREIFFT